jgi:hemolysin III
LGVVGAVVLITLAIRSANGMNIGAALVYVTGLLSMLGASAAYNCWPPGTLKRFIRRFDHSAIYLLIAATYTPFLLHIRDGTICVTILIFVWIIAFAGIALKLLWPQRFERTSIALYLALGWSGALVYESVATALRPITLWLIAIGGLLYSVGVIFHLCERLRFHSAIWHCFVLCAACAHYAAVLSCVI